MIQSIFATLFVLSFLGLIFGMIGGVVLLILPRRGGSAQMTSPVTLTHRHV